MVVEAAMDLVDMVDSTFPTFSLSSSAHDFDIELS